MATGTTDDEAVLVWMLQILHQAARFEQNLPIDNGVDREAMRAAGVGQYSLPTQELQTRRVVLNPPEPALDVALEMDPAPEDLDETAFILSFSNTDATKPERAPTWVGSR